MNEHHTGQQHLEIKLRIMDPAIFEDLIQDPLFSQKEETEVPSTAEYETVFYDTADFRLRDQKIIFGIRKSDDEITAEVKKGGAAERGIFARKSWRVPIEDELPSLHVFRSLPIGDKLLELIGPDALLPLFKMKWKMTKGSMTTSDGSKVDLAAFRGSLSTKHQWEEICELQLSQKEGNRSSLFEAGEFLSRRYPLMQEEKGKYLRGLLLSGILDPSEVQVDKAHDPVLRKDAGIEEIKDLLESLVYAIQLAQREFLQRPEDPESTHRLRVLNRKLRSALFLFKPLILEEEYRMLQSGLRDYASLFGPLREMDILIQSWTDVTLARIDLFGGTADLVQDLSRQRGRLQEELYRKINRGTSTWLFFRIRLWLESSRLNLEEGSQPKISKLIRRRLADSLKKFRKELAKTDLSDEKAAHAVRIRCKKLNYSVQLLTDLKADGETRTGADLKILQRDLGNLCDLYRNIHLMRKLVSENETRPAPLEVGVYIGYLASQSNRVIKKIKRLEWSKR